MPSNDTRKTSKTRRRFLALTAGATAGLAGCTGGGGGGGGGSTGGGGGGSTGGGGGSTGGGGGSTGGGGGSTGGGGGSTGGGGGPGPSQAMTVGGVTIPSIVVQRANEEGEVTLYSTMDEPDIVGMFKPAFEEHFPDITVTGAGFGSGEISTKLLSEFRADQVTGDVAELNLGTARAVSRVFNNYADGHWLKQQAAAVGYADPYYAEGAFEFPGHGNAYSLVYNTELMSEGDAPDSWEALGDDQYTGQNGIVMQHPSNLSSIGGLYATLYGLWGEEKWIEQVGRLMDNQPQLISSNSQSYRVMLQGERALTPNYLNDLASQLDAGESPPAAVKWLEPALLNFSPSCVTKNAPHPNAAMALVAWFMSEDGQSIVGDTGRTPLLPQVATSHDIVQQIVPEGVAILPTAYNNPTYQGANFLTNPQGWVPLFNEHFGEQ